MGHGSVDYSGGSILADPQPAVGGCCKATLLIGIPIAAGLAPVGQQLLLATPFASLRMRQLMRPGLALTGRQRQRIARLGKRRSKLLLLFLLEFQRLFLFLFLGHFFILSFMQLFTKFLCVAALN